MKRKPCANRGSPVSCARCHGTLATMLLGAPNKFPQLMTALGLIFVFLLLSALVAIAQVEADLRMSLSPDGSAVEAVQTGTAKIYAVLEYEGAAQTEFKLRIFYAGGIVVFEQSATYDGSGVQNIEISGQSILADNLVVRTEKEVDEAIELVQNAQDASLPNTKRVNTQATVSALRSLDGLLAVLELYTSLPLSTLENLEDVRDLVAQAEEIGCTIITNKAGCTSTNNVSDAELDLALTDLAATISSIEDQVGTALEGIDTDREWALVDGIYTTTLYQNGQYKDGFDWEVSSEGMPGTPATSPTITLTLSPTTTPSLTPEPTATPSATRTRISATFTTTFTPSPTVVTATPTPAPTRAATPTPQPAAGLTITPTTTQTSGPDNAPGTPIILPPTAQPMPTQTTIRPEPTSEVPSPGQPPSQEKDEQTAYPEPMATDHVEATRTPIAQVLIPGRGDTSQASAPAFSRETPLPPQTERHELPVVQIAALMSAIVLGIVALWLRASLFSQ